MNLPNKLTILRVFLIPFFLFFLLTDIINNSIYIALFIFVFASFTDMLDGYIARKYNLITNFGKFMDPIADKLLVSSALIGMVSLSLIPPIVVILIIGRDLIINGFRLVASDNNVVIEAYKLGKIKTVLQMVMIIYLLFNFTSPTLILIGNILIYLVVIFTLASAYVYIKNNIHVIK